MQMNENYTETPSHPHQNDYHQERTNVEHVHCGDGNWCEIGMDASERSYDLSIPVLGINTKKYNLIYNIEVCMPISIIALFLVAILWNQQITG